MLSIANIAGAGSGYYLANSASSTSYYLDGESRTYWGGGAKQALGLSDGEIKKEDFDRLMNGHVSDGQRIGNPCNTNGWKHNPGRDLTFSAPKSVSILLQSPLRLKLLEIQKRAISKAMGYGEEHFAKARIKGEIVGNQKMIWAAINEDTSRANDPDSHTHIVAFNIVQGENGKFTAMDNQMFYDNQVLLGQIYRSELAKGVKELGFGIEAVGQNGQWEIKDIPQDIRENFSKRRQQIIAELDPENDTAKMREKVCLITRPKKQNLIRTELLKSWSDELKAHGTSFEELAIPKMESKQIAPYNSEHYVKTSMNIISETNENVNQHDLRRAILSRSHGHLDIDRVNAEIDRQISKGFLTQSIDGEHLTRSIDLRRKKQVTSELQKGHLKSKPILTEQQLESILSSAPLKNDQKAAIKLMTRSNSRYVKIQGDAGVGKTFALETAVPAIKKNGYKVVGLSTTSESTEVLEQTGVFDKVMTFQQYLLVPQGDKKTVLVIDESSMIGRDQMLSLIRFTNQKQMARVIFQGDANQMSSVQAGEPFRHMEEAGVRSVTMKEIIRQKDVRHRKGISELSSEKLRESFLTLKPEIHEVAKENMVHQAIKAWRESGNIKTPIIIQTNRQKNEINAAIKAQEVSKAANANSLTLKTWQTIHLSDTEKRFVKSYKGASHIRFNRDYKRFGIKRGDIYKLEGINRSDAALTLSKGRKKRLFRPAKYKMAPIAIEVYRQEERTLHEGDRIKFTRGGHRQPVSNNQHATITKIKGDKVTFELDKKTQTSLKLSLKDNQIRHIDHAWASTAHAFQGKTVNEAILLMPSQRGPLTKLESLYTGASRHRYKLTMITDDANALLTNLEKALNVSKLQADIKWPELTLDTKKNVNAQDLLFDKKSNSVLSNGKLEDLNSENQSTLSSISNNYKKQASESEMYHSKNSHIDQHHEIEEDHDMDLSM